MSIRDLHPGYVVEMFGNKERTRICITSGRDCDFCDKPLVNEKCLRHEKGGIYLLWECFDCYEEKNK